MGAAPYFRWQPSNDCDGLVNLIEQYLKEKEWRNEVATRARKFAEENLSWGTVAKEHLKAYRDLIAE